MAPTHVPKPAPLDKLRTDALEARKLSMSPGLNPAQVAALEGFADGIDHALITLGHTT